MSLVKHLVNERNLLQFSEYFRLTPLVVSALFGVWMMDMYASSHNIVTNVALASISFILIGFFMISTAITLYAITRISTKFKHNEV
jgi:amino acid transporter